MSNFDEKTVDRIKKLEREVERLRVKESPGAWTSWTPTVTFAGGTTDPSSTTKQYARYTTIGKIVIATADYLFGGGGNYDFSDCGISGVLKKS